MAGMPLPKFGYESGVERLQIAALPYRVHGGKVQILLISSRETKRWVLPKGWPMKGRTMHGSAAREAREEAGIAGDIEKTPFGSYRYYKRRKDGAVQLVRVSVYPLRVERQHKTWVEKGQRVLAWFSPAEAAENVHESELSDLILRFEAVESGWIEAARPQV